MKVSLGTVEEEQKLRAKISLELLQPRHVLMDLTKFLSACTFMYLQDKVNEKHAPSRAGG